MCFRMATIFLWQTKGMDVILSTLVVRFYQTVTSNSVRKPSQRHLFRIEKTIRVSSPQSKRKVSFMRCAEPRRKLS